MWITKLPYSLPLQGVRFAPVYASLLEKWGSLHAEPVSERDRRIKHYIDWISNLVCSSRMLCSPTAGTLNASQDITTTPKSPINRSTTSERKSMEFNSNHHNFMHSPHNLRLPKVSGLDRNDS